MKPEVRFCCPFNFACHDDKLACSEPNTPQGLVRQVQCFVYENNSSVCSLFIFALFFQPCMDRTKFFFPSILVFFTALSEAQTNYGVSKRALRMFLGAHTHSGTHLAAVFGGSLRMSCICGMVIQKLIGLWTLATEAV